MKKLLILVWFVIMSASVSIAQKNAYGLSIGVGSGMIMKQELDGGPSYDLNTGFSVGLHYSRKLTRNLYLMTGLNLYKNTISVTPNFYPGIDMTPKNYDVQLIYIPVFLKIDLSKYFFFNGGLIGDFDTTREKSITSQSGLGVGVGIGTEISFANTFAIQLNPYLNFHGLLLAKGEAYPEHLFDAGVKLNLILKK